jgi:hypothetical protein
MLFCYKGDFRLDKPFFSWLSSRHHSFLYSQNLVKKSKLSCASRIYNHADGAVAVSSDRMDTRCERTRTLLLASYLGPYSGAYWMASLRSDLDKDAVAAGPLDEI